MLLPEGVMTDWLAATCSNGILDIVAPMSEGAKPRRIEIRDLNAKTDARTVA